MSTTGRTRCLPTPATRGRRTTSRVDSDSGLPARAGFHSDLEQLRLQVEVMALKVDEALKGATTVLQTGDLELARQVVAADDEIDSMLVSLTERCYDLLCRQTPVASDLRLVVSVVRILGDLERVGDLCLRIVKLAPDQHLLTADERVFEILQTMVVEAKGLFEAGLRAWSTQDLELARTLERKDDAMDGHNSDLLTALLALEGPVAVPQAITALSAGRALERIADHSVMIGERLRYMLTGDLRSLSKEVGP